MLKRHVVRPSLAVLLVLPLAIAGCDRDDTEIKVYKVVKAPTDSATAPAAVSSPKGAETRPPSQIVGAAPPEWEAQPASQMRQASFLAKGADGAVADISLVILGGGAGGHLDNVNRWLGQLGQPPIAEEDLAASAESISTPIGDGILVDLVGLAEGADSGKDGRIVAAILSKGDESWFFKMRGNADLVAAQKDGFRRWVESVRLGRVETPQADAPPVAWDLPGEWQPGKPSQMRFASFSVPGPDGATADVSVVAFPGDVGGDLANVNRWRGQLGLGPIDAAGLGSAIIPLETPDGTLSTVDFENGGNRILAGWTQRGGKSWFFKMSGPTSLLEARKPEFEAFLRSVHFHR